MHSSEEASTISSAGCPKDDMKTAGILYMERIFVGNLDSDITELQLNNLFQQYGPCDVKIIREKNGTSKGYGFVTFNDVKIVEILIQQRTVKLQNRTLNIGLAIRRIKHPEQMNQIHPPMPSYHNFGNVYIPPAIQYVANSLPFGNHGNALLGSHGNALLGTPAAAHIPAWPYVPHF